MPPKAKPDGMLIQSYYGRKWEHLKLFQYRCFIHCRLPIYKDKQTGELRKAEIKFSKDHSRFTILYEQEVMRLMSIHHCFTSVARQLHIRTQRVQSIYNAYSKEFEEDSPLSSVPLNIACDETSTRKGHQYITTFFDLDTWKIIGIYDGKSSDCVESLQKNHPDPGAVKNISIDMSPAFISGANTYFANARITFDKCHVIKLMYKHLDKLGNKVVQFKELISILMNDLTSFYQQQKEDQFKAQLLFIADFAFEQLKQNPLTKMILHYFEGIANYATSRINNGVMEGLNSKIQLIKRVATGFRNNHNFKKMIRFVFHHQYQVNS